MAIKSSRVAYKGFFTLEVLETDQGKREVVRATDSVNILIHDTVNRRILLVREPRASLATEKNPDGLSVASVAGRFDVALGPQALAAKEAQEEVGVTVRSEDVKLLNFAEPMAVSAGMTNEKCYLAYVEVHPDVVGADKPSYGVASERERTERVWISEDDLEDYVCEDVRVYALIQRLLRKLGREEAVDV